jgi:SAM-dependent methyltransferase
MRLVLTGVLSSDTRRRMDLAYWLRDPWRSLAPGEQQRLADVDSFIARHVGPHVESALEIGCGEGHHSLRLVCLADRLTAIDVSRRAIRRAQQRVPSATFVCGDLLEQPWANERARFELVTACEVLYYVRDKERLLRTMDRLARHCVVTYYGRAAHLCDPVVMAMPGAERTRIERNGASFVLVHWKGEGERMGSGASP